jgi:hypothetical protein
MGIDRIDPHNYQLKEVSRVIPKTLLFTKELAR